MEEVNTDSPQGDPRVRVLPTAAMYIFIMSIRLQSFYLLMTRLENQFLGVAATMLLWLPVKCLGVIRSMM